MKRLFMILACSCMLAVSCTIIDGDRHESSYELEYLARTFLQTSMDLPVSLMEDCVLVNDYINASDEERQSVRFSRIGYFAAENKYTIAESRSVYTGNKGLDDEDAVWDVKIDNYSTQDFTVSRIADNRWKIVNKKVSGGDGLYDYYQNMMERNIDFVTTAELKSRDSYGYCIWTASTEGKYTEDNRYSATFSADDYEYRWSTQAWSGHYSTELLGSGMFHADYFVDGAKTDTVNLRVKDNDLDLY